MKTEKLYVRLAHLVAAVRNCEKSGNTEWEVRHTQTAESLVKGYMPSGSGFDSGTVILMEQSTSEKLIFSTSFHHMVDGMYDGWTDHTVTVRPSLMHGFVLTIGGRNRNDIKEYVHDVFTAALDMEVNK